MVGEDNTNVGKCQVCEGTKYTYDLKPCSFCNSTGIGNKFAEAFMRNHICYCSTNDRKNCPICKKKCHHSSSLKPYLLSAP